MTGYHVSPAENRLGIWRWGLIPRDTGSHPRSHYHDVAHDNHGVEAVYVHLDRDAALYWRQRYGARPQYPCSATDVWAVDLTGLELEKDAYVWELDTLATSRRCLTRIGPERLTLVHAGRVR